MPANTRNLLRRHLDPTGNSFIDVGNEIAMLRRAAPRMLVIDEVQHLLSCNFREQKAALNAIKFLANQLRVSVVAAGTHEALHVMRHNPQIASRVDQIELPIWTETHELRRFVAGYLALLPPQTIHSGN